VYSKIDLSNSPNQRYTITIPGDSKNISLIITQSYNTIAGYWIMNLYDADSANALATNIPMITGVNLLHQLDYLGLGYLFLINTGDQTITDPDDTNLEDNFKLLWELD